MLPTTPYSKSNHFGLAISAYGVRATVTSSKGQIVAQAEVTVTEPFFQSDSVNEKALTEALTALKAKVSLKNNFAAVCIPEKYAFTRQFTLPALGLDEVDEALSWQLEKIFPFPAEEIYYDWKILSQTKSELTVSVVAIQKKLLDGLRGILEKVGIAPISFEPSAATLSKLIDSNKNSKHIVVEVDANGSAATLVIDGISLLTTTTNTPANADPNLTISEIIASVKSLFGYLSKNSIPLEQLSLIVTGDQASDALSQAFGTALNIPASVASIANVPPAFHLSYIAAVEEVAPPSNAKTINLLPTALQTYYRAIADHVLATAALKLVATISIVTSLFAVAVWAASVFLLTSEQRAAQTLLQNPPPSQSAINVPEVMRQSQRIIALFPKKKTPEATLNELIKIFPAEIVLSNIRFDTMKRLWEFEGTAKNRDVVFVLKEVLESSGFCTNIHIPLSSLEGGENRPFKVSCVEPIKPL